MVFCLSPHGESGLKSKVRQEHGYIPQSLPAWGEWVEIKEVREAVERLCSLSPHGESGLKSILLSLAEVCLLRLSPHGESGLKS